ncbi:unnamed protein product [Rhizoctonia solani]|uniref:Uncharacterized protein n=1 Tax=Rhizoctonia solani TaxID=456999 RepID=A0A8H3HJ15_9AGAM|nr:unnamed protein product [Rhizoctonia solani]
MNSKSGFRRTLIGWISSSSTGHIDSSSSRPTLAADMLSPPTSSPQKHLVQRGRVLMEYDSRSPPSRPPPMSVPQPASSSARLRSRILSLALSIPENETYALPSLAAQCALNLSDLAEEPVPVPVIDQLVGSLKGVFQAAERSRVNRDQWKLLRARCMMIVRIAGAHVDNYRKNQYPKLDEASALLQEYVIIFPFVNI